MPCHHSINGKPGTQVPPLIGPIDAVRLSVVREVGELRKRESETTQRLALLEGTTVGSEDRKGGGIERSKVRELQQRHVQRRVHFDSQIQ